MYTEDLSQEYLAIEQAQETKRLAADAVNKYRVRLAELREEAARKRRATATKEVEARRADASFLSEFDKRPVKRVWARCKGFPWVRREPVASTNELMHRATRGQQ